MIIVQERVSTSANNNNYLRNCNLTDRDPTTGFLTLPIFDESIISDDTMNENIINSNGVMVADMNVNIDIPVDREIINNEDIQQIGTVALSKSSTRKEVKNVTKWKRVATKIARLKGSPYHSTVAKKRTEIDGLDTCNDCDAFERKLLDVVGKELKRNIVKEKEIHVKAAEERYYLKSIDKKEAEASLGEIRD
ncbi:unnamed protein product [Parnassius apollo]|uniref:(apollo) hypothetical protein n=1 Tax=Parnassius apollo TaxID=110799 RepID=A0A8S3XTQ7_PARAO|nr:unnamed protein product [Parnassius apollo]